MAGDDGRGAGGERGVAAHDADGVGEAIRARRLGCGLTLQQVAERAGCTRGYLSLVENGRKGPPGEALLRRIEAALGVDAGGLVRAAAMERAPEAVREEVAALRRGRDAYRSAVKLLGTRGKLDESYRSGALERFVHALEGDDGAGSGGGGVRPAALPFEVPLINSVSAGYPRDFTDLGYPARTADDYVRCPDVDDPDAFAARIVGDSMAPDYREGDIVVFSPARAVSDGDDCFVRLEPDHETTFKRVYFERGADGVERIRMQPINSRYAPRVEPRERVAGLYRAVTAMRSL